MRWGGVCDPSGSPRVLVALKLSAFLAVLASTCTATRLFEAKLHMRHQRYLVAYPLALIYSCFVLITIF